MTEYFNSGDTNKPEEKKPSKDTSFSVNELLAILMVCTTIVAIVWILFG